MAPDLLTRKRASSSSSKKQPTAQDSKSKTQKPSRCNETTARSFCASWGLFLVLPLVLTVASVLLLLARDGHRTLPEILETMRQFYVALAAAAATFLKSINAQVSTTITDLYSCSPTEEAPLTRTTPGAFQIPEEADRGQPVIPNILDNLAVDAQEVCPGYNAKKVEITDSGLRASLVLAGDPCNIYGNDVEELLLVVQYQSADRLSVSILPADIKLEEETWYILPDVIVPKPKPDPGFTLEMSDDDDVVSNTDLIFSYTNEPSFGFKITRKTTNDVLFDSERFHLVFEDQFVELATHMPENYNVNGLAEVIHDFKISNNHTRKSFFFFFRGTDVAAGD